MPIYLGGQEIKECYIGGQPVQQIYIGGQEVWSAWKDIIIFHYDSGNWGTTYDYKVDTTNSVAKLACSYASSGTFFAGAISPDWSGIGGAADVIHSGGSVATSKLTELSEVEKLTSATKGSTLFMRASELAAGAQRTNTSYGRQNIATKQSILLPKQAKYFNIKADIGGTSYYDAQLMFGVASSKSLSNSSTKIIRNNTFSDSNSFTVGNTYSLSLDISPLAGTDVYFFVAFGAKYSDSTNQSSSSEKKTCYVYDMFVSKQLPNGYTEVRALSKKNV